MTTTQKRKINGYFVVLGLLAVTTGFYLPAEKIEPADLTTATVTLAHNAEYSKSQWRGSSVYLLRTREARADFVIDVAGGIAANWKPLDSLRTGDTLSIQYARGEASELNDAAKEITIYSLQKASRLYFGVAEYNASSTRYGNKLAWFTWIAGVLLLLNGLTILKDKTTYILLGVFLGACILLRMIGVL
jgi:hypothetical protein